MYRQSPGRARRRPKPASVNGDAPAMICRPGAVMSGLMMLACGQVGTTRREDRHRRCVVDGRRLLGLDLRPRPAAVGDVVLDLQALGEVDVHRRHPEVVAEQVVVVALVVQDHALAAGVEDREALVDATVATTAAEHDLALHLGGIERVGQAQVAGAGELGIDNPQLAGAPGHRGARDLLAVVELDRALEEAALRVGAHGRHPRHVGRTADGFRARTRVAGRYSGEHSGIGSEEERDRVGSHQVGAATDRVVDDVDAV